MKTLITYDARDGNTYSIPCNDEKKSFIKDNTDKEQLKSASEYHFRQYVRNDTDS